MNKLSKSAPYNGNFIHVNEKRENLPKPWKKSVTPTNSNISTHSSYQIKENVATNSRPETNLPNGNFAPADPYKRSSRGLPSYNPSLELVENKQQEQSIGRYSGIYTSARGQGSGRSGPLNPIKHWRKQLIPSQGYVTGKPSLDNVILNPGGSTVVSQNEKTDCCGYNNNDPNDPNGMLFTYINRGYQNQKDCNCKPENVIRNQLSNYQPVAFNNPERITRPRSSQTILKKNYYTTSSAYLKSRVKLYDQNQTLSKIPTNYLTMNDGEALNNLVPPSNNNWVYPVNDSGGGSQLFYSNNCISDPSMCCNTFPNSMKSCQTKVIFKPNNPFYGVQGAVDASTRILQAKYNAITSNNYDFSITQPKKVGVGLNVNSIAGVTTSPVITLPGATPMKYRGDSYRNAAPYFIKSKYQRINACSPHPFNFQSSIHSRPRLNGIGNRQPSGGTGIITTCFYNAIRKQ